MPDDEKFSLDEAKAKLKEKGFVVMAQRNFDEIVDEKYGKGFDKGKAEAESGLSDEQKQWKKSHEELPKLKTKLEALEKEKPDLISKAEHEALLKVERDKLSVTQEEIKGLKSHQKDNELLKAIGPWAVDADAVLALTKDKFALDDDGKVHPVNEKGEKLIDGEGHVTVERFYQTFQKEKPYLAKASGSSGAGSGTDGEGKAAGSSGGKYTTEQLSKMSMDEFAKAGGMDAITA